MSQKKRGEKKKPLLGNPQKKMHEGDEAIGWTYAKAVLFGRIL